MGRFTSGLLVAPLFPAIVAASIAGLYQRDLDTVWVVAFACLLGGYIGAFVVGVPLFLVWRQQGWTNWQALVALGMVSAGCVALVALLLLGPGREHTPLLARLLNLLAFTLPLGGVGGFALWWFGVRGNVALTKQSSGRDEPL
jgi:hypothetical protein